MRVAIDEPGGHQAPFEIDDRRAARRLAGGSDPGNPAVIEEHGSIGDQAIGHRALNHGGERSVLEEQGHFD